MKAGILRRGRNVIFVRPIILCSIDGYHIYDETASEKK